MFGLTIEQITSGIRQLLLFGGGFVVAKGWIDNETLLQIVGAVTALIASYFAFKTRTKKGLVASAAHQVPVSVSSQKEAGITDPISPKV